MSDPTPTGYLSIVAYRDAEVVEGMRANVELSPPERDPASAVLNLSGEGGDAQIIAWSNGQAQLIVFEASAGSVTIDRYIEMLETADLKTIIGDVKATVGL